MPQVSRVTAYTHLTPYDLTPPGQPEVFFEPADTEIGVWVAADLLPPGGEGTVLDLGSGSGAAAAAIARAGAARVHGIDSGRQTLRYAQTHYASEEEQGRVTFAFGDFALMSAEQLLATAPEPLPKPLIVTSNPAYVPLPADMDAARPSISGGADGLKWAGAIINHARTLGADLGFTFGSYSSPRRAVRLLQEAGYRIAAVTLCPLPLGDFTRHHPGQVLDLEQRGEAVLWRSGPDPLSYFIIGLSCRRTNTTPGPDTADKLMNLLHMAARSATTQLETVDTAGGAAPPWPVRILDLPPAAARHHW